MTVWSQTEYEMFLKIEEAELWILAFYVTKEEI